MPIFKEIPPTAGFGLKFSDILGGFEPNNFENCLKEYLQAEFAKVTYSGTAAFYFILEAIKELTSKKTIIIPAYICPLIPLAIKKAGLKALVCDTQKDNFDYDQVKLKQAYENNSDVAAILAVHLAGLPLDMDMINQIAQQYGALVIEDCAQSLGAEYKNKKIGTLGDFSFFSFCRGKGLTIYEGGVIVAQKKEYIPLLEKTANKFSRGNIFSELLKILELIGYWIFYRPLLFWFVFSLPEYIWKISGNKFRAAREYYDTNFGLHAVSAFRQRIGAKQFKRLDNEIKNQKAKATQYINQLNNTPGIKFIKAHESSKASYPFLTLLIEDLAWRDKIKQALEKKGLGVSSIYECVITDYGYLKDYLMDSDLPNARYLADHELTLSTSSFIKESDIDTIVHCIKST